MSTINFPAVTALQLDGAAAVGTDALRLVAPVAGRLTAVAVSAGTAPAGADLIVNVNVNGVSVFAAAGDQPTIADGTQGATAAATAAADDADFAAGDVITVDVDQVGATTAGSDLTVALVIEGDETP